MKKTKKTFWIILVPILLIPLLFIMGKAVASNSVFPLLKTPVDPFSDMLKYYEESLKSDKISKEEKDQLKEKYAPFIRKATERASRIQKEKPEAFETLIHSTPTPMIIHQREIADGIDKYPIIPDRNVFPKDIFPINGWHKKVGDATLFVYAGYHKNDPSQGMIYVKEPGKMLVFKKFLAPANSGKLHVVSEDKMLLTLRNETGQTYYFDAKKENFVDQDGNAILEDNLIDTTPTVPAGYPAP